ncbi:MAG: TatD family hydrolase [Candidatus Daviesbacteria bacterium]|nr:TatD family hydrolase [Candidatus Daviesbacteria bacterium]
MLIDTHAHLYWESFKQDFDEVIKRSLDAGVSTIINVGVDIEKSQTALDQIINTKWPAGLSIYSTIGIHPHEANKYESDTTLQNDIAKLEQIYQGGSEKVVAMGECGLDFYFDNNPDYNPSSLSIEQQKDLQIKLFIAHIDLAKKLNLPLIVHCRDDRSKNPQNSEAWDKVLALIGDQPAILHCYSGLAQTTLRLRSGHSANLLVSFAANVTYPKNEYLRQAAKLLPLDRILLETDSPFLAPQSKRGQRNEPANVAEIAQLIADLKGISLEEVADQTTANAKAVFKVAL